MAASEPAAPNALLPCSVVDTSALRPQGEYCQLYMLWRGIRVRFALSALTGFLGSPLRVAAQFLRSLCIAARRVTRCVPPWAWRQHLLLWSIAQADLCMQKAAR